MNRVYSRALALLSAAALSLSLCACGASSSGAPTVDFSELEEKTVSAAENLPDMSTVTDADDNAEANFAYIGDMDYDKIEHYFMTYSSVGDADEIVVIQVKDEKDTEEALTLLEDHLEGRVKLYTEYDQTQVSRAEDGITFSDGYYAVLVICDNADEVKAAFTAAAEG